MTLISTIFGWLAALFIAVGVTIAAVTTGQSPIHMAVAALVSLGITLLAVFDRRKLLAGAAPDAAVASSTARHLGLLWAWGGLTILISYVLIIDRYWPEWWHFFIGFSFAAIASILFARMLDKDLAAGRSDDAVTKAGSILLKVQVVGMIVAIVSLFVDGKFPRSATYVDWVGCNIFFFGALGVALISIEALLGRSTKS